MQENYQTRKVKKEDAGRIWEIRNDPSVRCLSNNPTEISLAQHMAWFVKKYFSGEDNHCFVLEGTTSKKIVGYCRLDADQTGESYLISIALDPVFHGCGLGGLFLWQCLVEFNPQKPVLAEIRKDNIPSLKLFQKNNFTVTKEDEKIFYLVKQPR